MSTEQAVEKAKLSVRNIGGIDDTSVTFTPGVSVLAGENATNRTSLLQAIMAALGSDNVSMKGDADSASVEITIDGEAYAREFTRQGSTVIADGEPYLEDPTLAELFAFLLESNEARRAVATNDDLRDLIMRPVDTDEIQRRIERHVRKRNETETELEELDGLKDRLPSLEEERTRLEAAIEEAKSGLADTEAELEARDANVEQTREEKAELEERLTDLRSKRSELEDIRYELETERESLEAARTRKRELEAEFEELPETPMGEIEERKARIEGLREQKRGLESEINEVQSVIRFNQDMLDDDDGDLLDALEPPADGGDGGELTDELLPDETVTCWTCGSDVPHEQIETTVTRLQELSQRKLGEINEIEDRLDDLTDEVRALEEQQRRRERLQRQRSTLEAELADSESAIERLTDRRETLQAEIEALEAEIESLEDDSYEEILDIHKEANQYEYELGRLEGELEDLESEIARIEGRLDAESELRQRREELTAEIGDLRTRIDRIEKQAIEGFNDHMASVLDILGYSNLERIWLERVEQEVREGRRKVTKSVFELHIVRQTDSGVTYEDTIDHLSESEREVTGLVFALAGYLAHEVYETVPFMLLDSLEAIDSDRIAALVEYVEGFSEYLVVALLPEDAAALSEEYPRISDI
ncbi:archaea-specific SMC-related protein [Natronomonas sp. LN261]|uniref:archaea-specific SMC-related protein n=1 Tax=Natronomonas sp. LN261 TaxID=2750669 RepID=UPI0015EF97CD|nr:archaea-specific SMC-related protein [Natronomonas sp. LN261]